MDIPFETIDWGGLPTTTVNGTNGHGVMRIVQHEGLRIRVVEYSANYLADHWCQLGHLVFVLEGELINEHEDGTMNVLTTGMSPRERCAQFTPLAHERTREAADRGWGFPEVIGKMG